MASKKGFTLIELLVSMSIVGVLFISAAPLYSTFRQRAHGSEANIMIKQLIQAEISYFIEHNEYFPPGGETYTVYHNGATQPATAVEKISENLKIILKTGHFIDYSIRTDDLNNAYITISGSNFKLFENSNALMVTIDQEGAVKYIPMTE